MGAARDLLALLRQRRLHAQKRIDVVTEPVRRRNPAGARVRLLQEAHLLEIGHHRAYGRGGNVYVCPPGDRMAAYRFSIVDVIAHDRRENAARAFVERSFGAFGKSRRRGARSHG